MNIYELAGNLNEWTLEKHSNSSEPSTLRGGYYDNTGNAYPVTSRYDGSTLASNALIALRVTFY